MSIVTTAVNSSPVPADRGPCYRTWQEALKDAVRDAAELCALVQLPSEYAQRAAAAARDFPVFAPRAYVARMRPGDPDDPLLRQVLPLQEEQTIPGRQRAQSYSTDPVGDAQAMRRPGLLAKYRSRVLMVTTGSCAVHCRYCFRRHFPYQEVPHSIRQWEGALADIAADTSLREVILSGGDPLMLVDEHLAELTRRLAGVGHLRRLRVHTRLPIMIPQRVTAELVAWLRSTRLTPIVVIHANHPRELQDDAALAIARLADAGIVLLNQAVLLRGVNDDVDTLAELCERLVDLRVQPYYLHQLDRVQGAAHFEVDERVGRRLITQLRRRLSGYAVPRYVREVAGAPYKVPLA
jgi:EF-P beta-lysylation protein EpmB